MNRYLRTISISAVIILLCSVSGCINISAQLQPVNESVKADKTGEDCKGHFMGFGYGTVTVERAMIQETLVSAGRADRPEMMKRIQTPITKVRSIALQDWTALILGERCIVVTGE
jgi:hypothetical protein